MITVIIKMLSDGGRWEGSDRMYDSPYSGPLPIIVSSLQGLAKR